MYVAHDLTRFLIHASELVIWNLEVFPCLYTEAIRLQCFPPTLCCKRGIPATCTHITLTTFTRFAQNSTVVSMLALYALPHM